MKAFVLSGGGSLGAWQVGQLQALLEADVRPDLLVGTSVGAINASVVAGDPSPAGAERLADVWRRIRRDDILPAGGLHRLRALTRKSLYSASGIRALVRTHAGYERIEDAAVPLRVVATSLETGAAKILSRGSLEDAVAASTAIPGIYPYVTVEAERLVDGGIVDNVPVAPAIDAGADRVYVFTASSRCPPPARLQHLRDILLFSAGLLLRPSTDGLDACYADAARVVVLPSSCPAGIVPFDFSKTAELIAEARSQTAAFLASGEAAVAASGGRQT